MAIKKILKITGIILLAIILCLGFSIAKRIGAMQSLDEKLIDKCYKIKVAPGAEDIQFDAETGLAFITADNRFVPHHSHDSDSFEKLAENGIYVVDVNPDNIQDIRRARKVSPENFPGFRPHGLYFWRSEDGEKRLFVVNHRTVHDQVDEVIEIFDIGEGGMLTHLESIAFPEMTNPNDVVAVGPRQFYVTNYLHHHRDDNKIYAELLFAIPYSSVVYFDGEKGQVVATGLAGANGINISPDQKKLYVNEWTKRKVAIYKRNADNTLSKQTKVSFPFMVDNVSVEDNGNLWLAGQPKLLELINFVLGKGSKISSVIAKMDAKTNKKETVFVSLYGEINASSVATIANDKLLIGSVYDSEIMICDKPE